MEFNQAVERYAIGLLTTDDLPEMALEAIEGGYDFPSLRQLAGATGSDPDEIKKLFHKAIGEIGIGLPSQPEAGLSIARAIAETVAQGKITPYQGAKQIWKDVYVRVPQLAQLRPFVGFASEYEDDEANRDEYSRLILLEAKRILECDS